MTNIKDGTKLMPHGLFYMENAGGCEALDNERSHAPALEEAPPLAPSLGEEHQPSCFALEEEKGEGWKGGGASEPAIRETRPSL